MTELTLEERRKRLADYVQTIAGDAPTESIYSEFSQDTAGLESLPKRQLQRATEAVKKSMTGGELSEDDIIVAEAIIHRTNRPSQLIQNGWFQPFAGDFRYMTEDEATKKAIRSAIPSVGRIDLPERPSTYGGTGFVVGKNLVMTNRHVAEIFTTGVGRRNVTIKPWEPGAIDPKREFGALSTGFPLTKCVMVHPYWDMALFIADLPDGIEPLAVSVEPHTNLLGRDVVVIGYPAFDPERNDAQVQQEIFQGVYNVKRIAPGRIVTRKQPIRSSWLRESVDAMAHDSSTLGGNSGSAVLDVKTGRIAGLHFAGRYMIENYSVPGYELARDPRVVDAGVNFQAPLPPASSALDSFWSAVEVETPSGKPDHSSSTGGSTSVVSVTNSTGSATTSNAVTVEIPLRITVSLGNVQGVNLLKPGDQVDTGTPSSVEAPAFGYDLEFLSESVPTPDLSSELLDDAFQLNGSPLLHYTHFSVCQSKSRTLPRFVAWNIDGGALKSLSRSGIEFRRDTRVPDQFQAGNELYSNNPYDRGHIARRADLTWGSLSEAKRANKDSFFFTNITPQHESFNQSGKRGLWGELENAILEDVDVEDLRVSVIAGPIFKENDPQHRGVRIPRDFWKLIAFRDTADNQFKVAAYILTQSELIPTEALELDPFRLYQVSLTKLADETGLDFDTLLDFDGMESSRESLAGSGVREISGRRDVI